MIALDTHLFDSLAMVFAGVEGSLDAVAVDVPSGSLDIPSGSVDVPSGTVDMPSASVDVPSGSVDVPSVDLSGKGPDVPSVGGDISGDLPSVDAKLTGPDMDVKGGDSSLGAGLATGVFAAVGATAVGLGLSGKADKPEGEVRVLVCAPFCGLIEKVGRGTFFFTLGSLHTWREMREELHHRCQGGLMFDITVVPFSCFALVPFFFPRTHHARC